MYVFIDESVRGQCTVSQWENVFLKNQGTENELVREGHGMIMGFGWVMMCKMWSEIFVSHMPTAGTHSTTLRAGYGVVDHLRETRLGSAAEMG